MVLWNINSLELSWSVWENVLTARKYLERTDDKISQPRTNG